MFNVQRLGGPFVGKKTHFKCSLRLCAAPSNARWCADLLVSTWSVPDPNTAWEGTAHPRNAQILTVPMTDPVVWYIYMLTWLGYIDGQWQTIYSIHTDPMGYEAVFFSSSNPMESPHGQRHMAPLSCELHRHDGHQSEGSGMNQRGESRWPGTWRYHHERSKQ